MEGTRRLGLGCQSGSRSGDGDWRPATAVDFLQQVPKCAPRLVASVGQLAGCQTRLKRQHPVGWKDTGLNGHAARMESSSQRDPDGVRGPRGTRGGQAGEAGESRRAGCWCGGEQAHAAKKRGQEHLQRCSMPSNRKALSPSGGKGLHRLLGNPVAVRMTGA